MSDPASPADGSLETDACGFRMPPSASAFSRSRVTLADGGLGPLSCMGPEYLTTPGEVSHCTVEDWLPASGLSRAWAKLSAINRFISDGYAEAAEVAGLPSSLLLPTRGGCGPQCLRSLPFQSR